MGRYSTRGPDGRLWDASNDLNYWLSLDWGRQQDYTAAVVFSRQGYRWQLSVENPYMVVLTEQAPLGTRYTALADKVADLHAAVRQRAQERLATMHPKLIRGVEVKLTTVLDENGVGATMFELLDDRQLQPVGVHVRGQGEPKEDHTHRHFKCHLAAVVHNLEVLAERGHLQFAKGLDDWPGLVSEFGDYQRKLSAVGRESFGNFRPGSHDDRLSALAIGLWHATYGYEELNTIKLLGV